MLLSYAPCCVCAVVLQAFAEVMGNNVTWSAPMAETYNLLGIDPASVQVR